MKREHQQAINQFIAEHITLPYDELIELVDARFGVQLSYDAIRKRVKRIGNDGLSNPSEKILLDKKVLETRKSKLETDKKYRTLLEENERLEKELEIALGTNTFTPKFITKPIASTKSEAVAFAIASDWHIEEEVVAHKVNGKNKYNLEIAEHRAKEFFKAVVKFIHKEQRVQNIDTLVLALLGDMISSNIHDELLESCLLRPIEAILFAEELLAGGIEYILEHTDVKLIIPCIVGNHTRITKRVHVSNEQGNSLETIMYHHLKKYFEKDKRVSFIISDSYHLYLPVYDNYTVRLHHGHNVRYGGGVGGLTIPMNKAIAEWQKIRHADLDVIGHFHKMFDGGNFLCNGSMIGFNAFALTIKAGFEEPKQVFFLIDKKRGKTVVAPICFTK